MSCYKAVIVFDDGLKHHGVKGQQWGVRRYQDESGRLTAQGRARLNAEYFNDYRNLSNLKNNANLKAMKKVRNQSLGLLGVGAGITALSVNGLRKPSTPVGKLKERGRAVTQYVENQNKHKTTGAVVGHTNWMNTYFISKHFGERTSKIAENIRPMIHKGISSVNKFFKSDAGRATLFDLAIMGGSTAAMAIGPAVVSLYRTTKIGHAKAQAKYEAAEKEFKEKYGDYKPRY